MTLHTPPSPAFETDWQEWARKLYEFMLRPDPTVNPKAVLLAHQVGNESAATSGLAMYDPTTGSPVVSISSAFNFLVNSADVKRIVVLASEAEYVAVNPKDPNTMYIWP